MSKQVQWRRGTATQNNDFTGAAGEVTVDTTGNSLRVHDGAAAGGFETARKTALDNHVADTDNPHATTKAQVGLGAVDNVSASALRDRSTHTGTQSLDTVTETASKKILTSAERTKLASVATGATANSTDAALLARANHTGTQAADTITETAAIKLMTAAERIKLAGVETGATADQTGAEIKAAYEAQANTNAYTDAEKTKLGGIATGADVTSSNTISAAIDAADAVTDADTADADVLTIKPVSAAGALRRLSLVSLRRAIFKAVTLITSKGSLVDGDFVLIGDSAASNEGKKVLASSLFSYVKSKTDPLYAPSAQGTVAYLGAVTGTGSAYALNATQLPAGGQLFYFTPHVASTADSPTLAITVGGTTTTTTLRGADSAAVTPRLQAGTIYLLRFGTGNTLVMAGGEKAIAAALAALEANVGEIEGNISTIPALLASARAVQALPVPTVYGSRQPLVIAGGAKAYQLQPCFSRSSIQMAGPAGILDCSDMTLGTELTIFLRSGDKVIAGAGRTFLGRAGGMATATGSCMVRVSVFYSGIIAIEEVSGTAPTYGAADAIAYDHSIVWGGQSNAFQAQLNGGIGGFSYGLRSSAWMTPVTTSIKWINGATGGTAIDRRSVAGGSTAYWWDVAANGGLGGPGPALDTYLSAIAAAISAGAPSPAYSFWTQGESDTAALQAGTFTTADMTATIRAVWAYIRTTYPSLEFVVNSIGGHDNRAADTGANAARVAYLDAIAAETFAHQGIDLYDLPRAVGNIHYFETCYAIMGMRLARVWANLALAQTNAVGPTVTAAVAEAGGARLTVSWGGPAYVPQQDVVYGPQPYGIYAIAPGDDAVDDPIPLTSAYLDGADIVVTADVDLTGYKIGGPWGYAANTRLGQVIRDYANDDYHLSPGQPLRSFLIEVT